MLQQLLRRITNRSALEAGASRDHGNPDVRTADRSNKKPSSRERDIRRDEVFLQLYERCAPYSMTTLERLYGVYSAIEYIVRHGIRGDIVECGVWRGGSMMMAALSLLHFGDRATRRLHLFDTFEGMPAPTSGDFKFEDLDASKKWRSSSRGSGSDWNYAPIEMVRELMYSTGFPVERIVFVKGLVEHTLPEHAPAELAMLRLDTDFYSSTKHELVHLFPRLVAGGVLIVDDFGTWAGCRRAVDEYFDEHGVMMLLSRLDASARIGVKRS